MFNWSFNNSSKIYKYLNTSHVNVQSMEMKKLFKQEYNLNTSHVNVQFTESNEIDFNFSYLNTSHVNVQWKSS